MWLLKSFPWRYGKLGAETVKNCPREWSESLKIYLYKVPTKKVVWKEVHQSVSERILRQERQMEKARKGKKAKNAGSEDDMDLPEAQVTGQEKEKNEQKEAKAAEAAVRKTQQTNSKTNMMAAKSIGQLSNDLQSLTKAYNTNMMAAKSIGQLSNDLQSLTKAYNKASNVTDNIKSTCEETQEKLAKWLGAAKATLQQAEDDRAKTGEIAIPSLPFELSEVRTLHQTCLEVVKNLKPYMPVPKAKATADAKRPADAGAGEGAPAKRRRGKTPVSWELTSELVWTHALGLQCVVDKY